MHGCRPFYPCCSNFVISSQRTQQAGIWLLCKVEALTFPGTFPKWLLHFDPKNRNYSDTNTESMWHYKWKQRRRFAWYQGLLYYNVVPDSTHKYHWSSHRLRYNHWASSLDCKCQELHSYTGNLSRRLYHKGEFRMT